jgi:hypothetical protein
MTIADRIREETTLQHIKGLIEEGLNANTISKAFKIPIKQVKDIINKIKEDSQS